MWGFTYNISNQIIIVKLVQHDLYSVFKHVNIYELIDRTIF